MKESKQRTFVQNWRFAAVRWSWMVALDERQRSTIGKNLESIPFAKDKVFYPTFFQKSWWSLRQSLKVLICLQVCFWGGAKRPVDVCSAPTGTKRRLWRNFSQVKKVPPETSDFHQVHNKPFFWQVNVFLKSSRITTKYQ